MKIRVLGAGFYGAHIAIALIEAGHGVQVHEINGRIFDGASGKIPARLHQGFHYPRSKKTRMACQKHVPEFMKHYGQFTHGVKTNIYAIAQDASMVDYPQYVDTLTNEVPFGEIAPEAYGLKNVEGALLTQERHIVTDQVKAYFEEKLKDHITYYKAAGVVDSPDYDLTIDATFCANDSAGIDRYEPCVVGVLGGPTDIAVTIMDGPFSSLYPWNEKKGLSSISSAKWTPFSKTCKTWEEAKYLLDHLDKREVIDQAYGMINDLSGYYPDLKKNYHIVDTMISIRAMPLSGADARLVDVVKIGDKALRVRAGKIDAVIQAARMILKAI